MGAEPVPHLHPSPPSTWAAPGVGKHVLWSLTFSPAEDTDGIPDTLLNFIKLHARKWHIVEEKADKQHVHALFVTCKGYSRGWGCKSAKDLGYNKVDKHELLIRPHKDPLRGLGYYNPIRVLDSTWDKKEIEMCAQYYKDTLSIAPYVHHTKAAQTIGVAAAQAIQAELCAREGLERDEAEQRMLRANLLWPGVKDYTAYITANKLKDTLMT